MILLIFVLLIFVAVYFYTKSNSLSSPPVNQPQVEPQPSDTRVEPSTQPQVEPQPSDTRVEPQVEPQPSTQPQSTNCIIGDWTTCPVGGGGYRTRNITPSTYGETCDTDITTEECGSYVFNSAGYCNCRSGKMQGEYKCQLSDGSVSQLCSELPPQNPSCEGTSDELQQICPVYFDIRLIPNDTSVNVRTQITGANIKDISVILQRQGVIIEEKPIVNTSQGVSVTFTNLVSGDQYVVYIRGTHTLSGQTVTSQLMDFTTTIPVPSNFTATRQPDNKILFSWNPVSGATKYTIYLGRSSSYQEYELVTTNLTTYLLDPNAVTPKLGVGSAYYFWIQSIGIGTDNMSWLSNSIRVDGVGGVINNYDWKCDNGVLRCYKDYTPVDNDYEDYTPVSKNCGEVPVIPFSASCLNKRSIPPPTNLTAIKTGSSIKLSWNNSHIVNIGGVGGYVIYCTKNNESQQSATYVYYTETGIDLPLSLIGATSNDRLSFYIVTRSGGGEGQKSEIVTV